MLGTRILKKCMDTAPRFNMDIVHGLAYKQSTDIEKYVDEVIRCASESFPTGLKYLDFRRATPEENIMHQTRPYRSKRNYELAMSDLYMCAYLFEFEGTLITKYMMLPYIRPGGIIRIRGASFTVSPVLTDNIFSVTSSYIYMPVTRDKLIFKKLVHNHRVNGEVASIDVVYASVFNIKREVRNNQRESTLIHYMLAKYGLTETFRKYFNTTIVVGSDDEINESNYPIDQYTICSSTGLSPQNKGNSLYSPTRLRIAVPTQNYTKAVASAIGGIYYILAWEPDVFGPEDMDKIMLWRRILPRFIKSDVGLETKAMEEMNAHFESLDAYIDDLVRRRLQKENIPCENIYDVFHHIIETFSDRTMYSDPADMIKKKQLETIRPLLTGIVYAISNLTFKLWKMQGERLNAFGVISVLGKLFPTNEIYKINKSHGEVTTLESATDLLPVEVTKNLVSQAKATSSKRNRKEGGMNDPTHALHASQAVVSSYLFVTKAEPSGRASINPFMQLDKNGGILIDPETEKKIEKLEKLLKHS